MSDCFIRIHARGNLQIQLLCTIPVAATIGEPNNWSFRKMHVDNAGFTTNSLWLYPREQSWEANVAVKTDQHIISPKFGHERPKGGTPLRDLYHHEGVWKFREKILVSYRSTRHTESNSDPHSKWQFVRRTTTRLWYNAACYRTYPEIITDW